MKMFCLLSNNEIDCDGMWSMLSAIVGIVVAIVIGIVQYLQSRKIAKIENENTETNQNIALFDKRYDIFCLFNNFYNDIKYILTLFSKEFEAGDLEISIEDAKDDIKELIFKNTSDLDFISAKNEYEEYIRIITDDKQYDKRKHLSLYRSYKLIELKNQKDCLRKLEMAEFCFDDEEVRRTVLAFSRILLNEINEESDNENENHNLADNFFDKLQKLLEEIEEKNVIEKMKKEIVFFRGISK